jgi:hypothetical protein
MRHGETGTACAPHGLRADRRGGGARDTGMETYLFSTLLVVACRGGSSGTTLNHYM